MKSPDYAEQPNINNALTSTNDATLGITKTSG